MSDDMVPRARLNEEIAKRKELEADHAALKASLTAAETKAAEADALRAQLATATAEHETFRVGVEAGITDPEGLELARYFYDKIQPGEGEERPAFADYMGKLKSDPSARPKALGAYFADSAPATATAPPAAPAAQAKPPAPAPIQPPRSSAPLPSANTGANPSASPAPTQAGWNAESIGRLTPEQFAAHQSELYTVAGAQLKRAFGGA